MTDALQNTSYKSSIYIIQACIHTGVVFYQRMLTKLPHLRKEVTDELRIFNISLITVYIASNMEQTNGQVHKACIAVYQVTI